MKRPGRKTKFCILIVSGLLGYGALGGHTMADAGTGARSAAGARLPELCSMAGALAHQGDPVQQAALSTERPGDRAFEGTHARQPTVVAQATDFNALVQMAEADGQGRTYRGPRHPSDHSRFHCVNAFFLQCRRGQGDEYRQAHQQACAQLQAAGMRCPHC